MNTNTRENIKKIARYSIQLLFIVAFSCILIWLAKQQEPIQQILNEIQINESELQQLEQRQNQLNQANEKAKQRLLNEYWLKLESQTESIDDSLNCPVELYEKYERDCVNHLQDDWKPWKLSEDWTHQEMPVLTGSDSHERFKELATAYWLDPSQIRAVEEHYWIKEWVILCITVAETSWWNRWYGWKNIWSVWSNDRWDRPTYALMESWLEAIGKTLTNQYLWWKKTLWCLSNAGSCTESSDNWKRYATSQSSREKNMVACLSDIYWPINASQFNIRR